MPPRNSSRPSALSRVPLGLNLRQVVLDNLRPCLVVLDNLRPRLVVLDNLRPRLVVLDNLPRAVLDNLPRAVLDNLHPVGLDNLLRADSLGSNQIRLGCNHLR
jgi:hypothetical protein